MVAILFLLCLSLIGQSMAQDTLYVKPYGQVPEGWPWNTASTSLDTTIAQNPDFGVIRVLPGTYWETVKIDHLSTLRTEQQIITGWIPDENADSTRNGHDATFSELNRIRIRGGLQANDLMIT